MDIIHFNNALESDNEVDIDDYLPIKTDEEAIRFCGNEDGLFKERKKALLRRLYGAGDTTSMATFVASVTDVFFHINYQISHRWPSKQ